MQGRRARSLASRPSRHLAVDLRLSCWPEDLTLAWRPRGLSVARAALSDARVLTPRASGRSGRHDGQAESRAGDQRRHRARLSRAPRAALRSRPRRGLPAGHPVPGGAGARQDLQRDHRPDHRRPRPHPGAAVARASARRARRRSQRGAPLLAGRGTRAAASPLARAPPAGGLHRSFEPAAGGLRPHPRARAGGRPLLRSRPRGGGAGAVLGQLPADLHAAPRRARGAGRGLPDRSLRSRARSAPRSTPCPTASPRSCCSICRPTRSATRRPSPSRIDCSRRSPRRPRVARCSSSATTPTPAWSTRTGCRASRCSGDSPARTRT